MMRRGAWWVEDGCLHSVYVSVGIYVTCLWVPIEVRESVGFLGAGVTDYWQMSEVGAGYEPGSSRRATSSCKR